MEVLLINLGVFVYKEKELGVIPKFFENLILFWFVADRYVEYVSKKVKFWSIVWMNTFTDFGY